MYYSMHYRYHRLYEDASLPYKIEEKFNSKWLLSFKQKGYFHYFEDNSLLIYYKITKSKRKNIFFEEGILEIFTILKDNQQDFYSDILDDKYREIWIQHHKKNKISKQVIIQIKKYDSFNETLKNDLDRIIIFHEGKNYLITVNGGYFEKESIFYYLHSKKYYPNRYYKYACDLIDEFIK